MHLWDSEERDKITLMVLFLILVGLASYFHSAGAIFDLCNDSASALLGALLVLITKKPTI